jgi:hypothetical protein
MGGNTKMDHKELWFMDADWIHLADNYSLRQVLVNMVRIFGYTCVRVIS